MVAVGDGSRRPELPEERRKRKEREAAEAEAKRRRAAQAARAATNIKAAAAGGAANALRTDTPFLADIRFGAGLPAPPGDPKALLPPLDFADLARFRLTDLEAGPVRDAPLGDVGGAISLLEPERYLPEGEDGRPAPLDPADAALVAAAAGVGSAAAAAAATAAPSPGGAAPAPPAGTAATAATGRASRPGTELAWLMRTTYIHAETETRAGRERAAAATTTTVTPAATAAAVEAEFAAAARPPIHPCKPGLKAVRVLPVLPDLEGWKKPGLVVVTSGADPLAGVKRGAALSAAASASASGSQERPDPAAAARLHAWLAGRGAVKAYRVDKPGGGFDNFVGLMVPAVAPDADALAAHGFAAPAPPDDPASLDGADPATTTRYDWVREFNYKVQNEGDAGSGVGAKRTFLFEVRGDAVAFSALPTRMLLQPRPPPPPGERDDPATGFSRPSAVFLQVADPTPRDEELVQKRWAGLVGE